MQSPAVVKPEGHDGVQAIVGGSDVGEHLLHGGALGRSFRLPNRLICHVVARQLYLCAHYGMNFHFFVKVQEFVGLR
jgi:hypothetical protein